MLAKGTILAGRYEIIEKIGAGGMAIVYKARCHKLDREVAIKVLREEYLEDEIFLRKFETEALQASKLAHPNIVSIFDVGFEDDVHYIVMEYINGSTLKKLLSETRESDYVRYLKILIEAAEALNNAHRNGIIHRDIKSQNIIITDDGKVKVADFGIATATTTSTISMTSNAIGSVHYFSPEQAKGERIDIRSDIYSLGIVMFEMFARVLPFEGETPVAVALKHVLEEMPNPRDFEPRISENIEHIILKCTKKNREERYSDLTEVIEDLRQEYDILYDGEEFDKDDEKKEETDETDDTLVKEKLIQETEQQKEDEQVHNNQIDETIDDENVNKVEIIETVEEYQTMEKEKQIIEEKSLLEEKINYNDELPDEIKDIYYDDNKSDKVVYIGAIATAAVIISIIFYIGFMFVRNFEKSLAIEAPNFIGKNYVEAEKEAKELGISLNKKSEVYSDNAEGIIVDQNYKANEKIQKNKAIDVVVSKGSELILVASVVGKEFSAAKTELEELGFSVNVETVVDSSKDAGSVLEQEPLAGELLKKSEVVTIKVAIGQENNEVVVPTVIDVSLGAAKRAIENADLDVGKVTYKSSDTLGKDVVISQSLKPGTKTKAGTKINLVVSNSDNQGAIFETTGNTTETTANKNTEIQDDNVKSIVLDINPIIPIDKEEVSVKVILISNTKLNTKYNRVCNKADFPFKITIEGKEGDIVQVYIDDKVQIEDVIK